MKSFARFGRTTIQSGFSLVEIMVALVVGLLASLVIMQVFSVFEVQKRTTTGSADAQTNGSIALFSISRDIEQAGYSLMPGVFTAQKCATLTVEGFAGADPGLLSSVSINDGVSDTITLRFGTSPIGGALTAIGAVGAPGPNDITVESNLGCNAPNTSLIINGTNCSMSSVTAITGSTSVTLNNIAGAVANASFACLGNWTTVTYSVDTVNGNLLRDGAPVIAGIVNLQAQYGISATATSNDVINWVDAIGAFAAPTLDDRNRIKAVRIAVVGRNAKREPNVVTTAPVTAWLGGGPVINLTGYGADWDHYRYRTFDTIIPLRNVIWARGML